MLTKKQIGVLLSIVVIFSAVGYINWKYREEINVALRSWKEKSAGEQVKDEEELDIEEQATSTRGENYGPIEEKIKFNPEEIKITETEEGRLRVRNDFDNYNFMLPEDWQNIEKYVYYPEQGFSRYVISTAILFEKDKNQKINISKFENALPEHKRVKDWVNELYDFLGDDIVAKDFSIEGVEAVFSVNDKGSLWVYFKGDDVIYGIGYSDKEEIKDMILSGEWKGEPTRTVDGKILD